MHIPETSQPAFEPVSYWHRTSPQLALSTTLPATIDVLVVGGGLFGTATAYWLARAGRKVALLDRAGIAYGASGRNGGFVVAGMHEDYPAALKRLGPTIARAVLTISYQNQAVLRQVLAEEQIECDYREPGSLGLALGAEQGLEIRESIEMLRADNFPVEWLERAEVQARIHTPLGEEIVGAKWLPGQALVHSARLIKGLALAAQRHGAQLYQAQALHLTPRGTSVQVETTRGNISAGAVVLAVNAWTSELLPTMRELIVPVRGQILSYAPLPPVFTTALFASLTETEEYWQQTLDGSLVLGGCRALAPGKDVGVWETSTTPEIQQAIEGILPRLFPQLPALQVTQRWAGLMDFSPDRIPIVDRVPDLANAWFVGGLSGHGMPFGMLFGQYLAQAIQNNQSPDALWPFALSRASLQNKL